MKKKLLLCLTLLLFCSTSCITKKSNATSSGNSNVTSAISNSSSSQVISQTEINPPAISSSTDYDSTKEIRVNLSENSTVVNNNGFVVIEENTIWILGEGVYILSGTLNGQIIVSAPEQKVEIELQGASITSSSVCPFLIYDADSCEISAKSGTTNSITDLRGSEVDEFSAALYANCDLKIKGKGTLNVENNFNNGIHTKDDLEIKNVTLNAKAVNNTLKGNDSLTIESGTISAISTKGDTLKTDNTSLSSKGNQRGTITISGGTLNLYAACDCIDASYNVVINNEPIINCFTESYSSYSEEVAAKNDSILYLRASNSLSSYKFGINLTLSDDSTKLVYAAAITGFTNPKYKYYSFEYPDNVKYMQVYVLESSATSIDSYVYKSEMVNPSDSQNCITVSLSSSSITLGWTTYNTTSSGGGPGGGMQEGNPDKAEYSCKGIKAQNLIDISGGEISIKSHDDAIHATGNVALENGETSLGNVLISGGNIQIYSDDDGVHGDNEVTISGGLVNITKSYEGVEGNIITFNGGVTQIVSSDDGINASEFNVTPYIYFKAGVVYVDASGDGIDSNGSIEMSGGYVIAQGPSSSGNGVLDYDKTFIGTGGYLLAIGKSGMNQSITASGNGKSLTKSISTTTSSYVALNVDGVNMLILKVTRSSLDYCVALYEGTSVSINVTTSISEALTDNLYYANN